MDIEKVIKGLNHCFHGQECCGDTECPYYIEHLSDSCCLEDCQENLKVDVIALLKEQDEEHRRLLSWLGKFCRHIDNGDAWLTDEENIAFFKKKMKQQFGWDTD